jgi:5-methylcytosine-specific restriction endonuclease McrA
VLKKRGVVASTAPAVWSLQTTKLTHTQRAALRAACHERLAKFLDAHDPWAGTTPTVGYGVPYQVFLAAGGRCLLCHQEKPLQVDHIQPQSQQGPSTLDNLQALCADCNQGKSDGQWIDFRRDGHPHRPTQKRAGVTYFWDQQPALGPDQSVLP